MRRPLAVEQAEQHGILSLAMEMVAFAQVALPHAAQPLQYPDGSCIARLPLRQAPLEQRALGEARGDLRLERAGSTQVIHRRPAPVSARLRVTEDCKKRWRVLRDELSQDEPG